MQFIITQTYPNQFPGITYIDYCKLPSQSVSSTVSLDVHATL